MELDWIQSHPLATINLVNLSSWKRFGTKASTQDPVYCDPGVYKELHTNKVYYHCKLSKHESSSARNRLNPFELVENGIFQNRAGMKLANIDADLRFALTSPRNPDGLPAVGPNETMYFVDICGGPGGFSEYMLYRKEFDAKGFGITLRNTELDYNMAEITAGPAECLEVNYGRNNTGNIYDPQNVKSFVDVVRMSTRDAGGAHVVVADGGVDMEHGKDFDAESACKVLYLSQILIGLQVLRKDGVMICKVFETQSVFSVGLMYLVQLCFEKVSIYKPKMSRPQNSERYLICFYKRQEIDSDCQEVHPILKYMTECHQILWEWSTSKEEHLKELDIVEIVPADVLKKSPAKEFVDKLLQLNTRLARNQLEALKEIREYAENPRLQAPRKIEIRAQCFEDWKIPMPEDRRILRKKGRRPYRELTDETYDRLCHRLGTDFRYLPEIKLDLRSFDDIFRSPYDWRVVVVQGSSSTLKSSRGFYMSQGGTEVFRFSASSKEWEEFPFSAELPKDTIFYGECVMEFYNNGTEQKKKNVLHIIDVLYVYGRYIGDLHYMNRYEIMQKLVRSVNKPSKADLIELRAKPLIRMERIPEALRKCRKQKLEGERHDLWTIHSDIDDVRSLQIVAGGLLFLKITKDPWMMSVSRSSRRKYWYHREAETSTYELPQSAVTSFINTMECRVFWKWDDNTKLCVPENARTLALEDMPNGNGAQCSRVDAEHFLKFLNNFFQSFGEHSKSPPSLKKLF